MNARKTRWPAAAWILVAAAAAAGILAGEVPAQDSESGPASDADLRAGLPENAAEGWYARIETSKGPIVAQLLPRQAPQSVAHFVALAEGDLEWVDPLTGERKKGRFYDGTRVHKALAGMRFETGDPTGTGRGGPALYVPEEGRGPVNFSVAGRLGMTRAPGSRISAHQFFVTASAQPFLNGFHPCFGVVIVGRDVVMEISAVKTYSNGRPIEPVTIESVRIFTIGDPPPLAAPKPHQPRLERARPIPGTDQR